MRLKLNRRPHFIRSGEISYVFPKSYLKERHELLLTASLVTNRYLFGLIYGGLCPQHFNSMKVGSGVFVTLVVPTDVLNNKITKPGDIDILAVRYDGDMLVLDQTIAIEVKAVRAAFVNQGRSPNSMGMAQAHGLTQMGFPYVAVTHLIVSDESPEKAWRPMGVARILDEFGNCELLPEINVDCMPIDLMARAMGKLKAARDDGNVGLAAAFLGSRDEHLGAEPGARGTWHPDVSPASVNSHIDTDLLSKIGALVEAHSTAFIDIPRFDPQ